MSKVVEMKRVPPETEIRNAVVTAARLGHSLLTVARRNGISTHAAWGMLADSIDTLEAKSYRRGYSAGRLSHLPNCWPRVAA